MKVRSLGQEDPLREEEPDWLQSIALQRGDMTEVTQHTCTHTKCFQKYSKGAIKS